MKFIDKEFVCQDCGDPLYIGKNWTVKSKREGNLVCSYCENPQWNKPKKRGQHLKHTKPSTARISTGPRFTMKLNNFKLVSNELGDYAEIPLGKGKVALVSVEDAPLISRYNWGWAVNGNMLYARRNPLKSEKEKYNSYISMHRFILGLTLKDYEETGLVVDHINGNGLDNRRSNLRVVSNRQNVQNRHSPSSSKYPGVSKNNDYKNPWESRINVNGIHIHIGLYPSELDAFEAYKKAVHELTGERVVCELEEE